MVHTKCPSLLESLELTRWTSQPSPDYNVQAWRIPEGFLADTNLFIVVICGF